MSGEDNRLAELEERVTKLESGMGGKKVKISKKDRPKRPPTAYQTFVKENGKLVREEWEKEGKEYKQTDVMKELGKRWKERGEVETTD